MKSRLLISFIALTMGLPALGASDMRYASQGYERGTVLSVQKHTVESPAHMGGNNPSDAPLTARYYAYDVAVRVDCSTYIGRFETPIDYLPSEFSAGLSIQLRLTKHVMYFNLANDSDMRMGIVHRTAGHTEACNAK